MSLNVLGSILTAIAAVGATALMARNMPVADFGRVLLLLTAVNAFAIFEGVRPVVIHRVAVGRESPHKLFRAAAQINAGMVGATLLCLLIAYLAGAGSDLPPLSDFFLAATAVAFFVMMQYWMFLDAEQDTVFTGLSRACGWTLLYLTFGILSELQADILWYILSLFLMHILLILALRIRFEKRGLVTKYRSLGSDDPIEPLLKAAINNIVFNVSAVTINVADRAIVGIVMGARSAGFYSGPSELALRANGLVRAGVQVILPWAARLSARDQDRYWSFGAAASLVFVGSGCAILLLVRDWATALFLGPAFRMMGDLLGLFGLGIVASTLGYVCVVHLNARGDFRTQRQLYIGGAIVLLAGGIVGALSGNLTYVAIAYLTARSVDLVLLLLILKRLPTSIQRWFIAIGAVVFLALVAGWNGWAWSAAALLAATWALGWGFWRAVRV
ncbi:hypothetical protein [Altererythrobacter sp. BO-6]|uniref:hypothetical protein n=1 Tax=Altererythrobacter sp. BO-6 TaxID=2604537 RepID=UPI0019D0E491|nr:hypothetical protein [Altererythrobacter sp. BO-6]